MPAKQGGLLTSLKTVPADRVQGYSCAKDRARSRGQPWSLQDDSEDFDWHVSRLFDTNTNEERFDLTEPFVRNAGQVKGPLKVKSDFTACIIPC